MGFLDGVKKKGTEISNNLQESISKQQKISTLKKTITENNSKIELLTFLLSNNNITIFIYFIFFNIFSSK